MKTYSVKGTRLNKFELPKEFDLNLIQIGIPVITKEDGIVGLNQLGDMVLPKADFGPNCKRNVYGDFYLEKTKPKEKRYVSTNSIYPFGNKNASIRLVDIYKDCYQRVELQPLEIELQLIENSDSEKYIIANLTEEIRKKYVKEVINIFLEIYGICYIFNGLIKIDDSLDRQRCNWEILPPGDLPSKFIKRKMKNINSNVNIFSILRLETIEKYKPEKIVEGINGFDGYFAYIFNDFCILESAKYGNATYIIPKENWEILSQKTKRELLDEEKVIYKLIHRENWMRKIETIIENLQV